MIKKINKIAKNPQIAKDILLKEEVPTLFTEAAIIENSIINISVLLDLGLGRAGTQIISQSI